jgi:hypothetical protein
MTAEQIDELADRIQDAQLSLGHEPPNAEALAETSRVLREWFAEHPC